MIDEEKILPAQALGWKWDADKKEIVFLFEVATGGAQAVVIAYDAGAAVRIGTLPTQPDPVACEAYVLKIEREGLQLAPGMKPWPAQAITWEAYQAAGYGENNDDEPVEAAI